MLYDDKNCAVWHLESHCRQLMMINDNLTKLHIDSIRFDLIWLENNFVFLSWNYSVYYKVEWNFFSFVFSFKFIIHLMFLFLILFFKFFFVEINYSCCCCCWIVSTIFFLTTRTLNIIGCRQFEKVDWFQSPIPPPPPPVFNLNF